VREIASFPAEARLFDGMDMPCISLVARRRRPVQVAPIVTVFDSAGRLAESRRAHIPWAQLEENDFIIPVVLGAAGIELLSLFHDLPRLSSLEGQGSQELWAGRELDETGRKRFVSSEGSHPFLKGGNIRRFGLLKTPTEFVDRALVPSSARFARLAWRDVSRPSQKRRVIATVIPAGWVCGNSLGVAYFRDNDLARLSALLGIFSSLAFEYQLRSVLSTGHVSLGRPGSLTERQRGHP